MRRLSRVMATVASVAVIGLVTGCGGDNPTPSAAPSSTPSDSGTGEPVPTPVGPPTQRALASQDSRRGAAAFVEFYIATLNYAMRTGDLEGAQALAAADCRSCGRILKSIGRVHDSGGAVRGGQWQPTPVSAVKKRTGWVVDVEIRFAPQRIIRSRGADAERYEGGKGTASFILKRRGATWEIAQWTRA